MSTKIRPTVVAISDKQPSALSFAIQEAASSGTSLRVLHAYGIPTALTGSYVFDPAMIGELRASGESVLDDARHFIDEHGSRLEVEYVLSPLTPLEALILEAKVARVMVVGADDVPWLERLFRTKLAGHLAKHAPCPVVVVPELEFPTGPDGEVVVTLDGATSAAGPLRMAFDEASARDCVLHILHATPPGTLESDAEGARVKVAEVLAGWRESYPDVMILEGDAVGDAAAVIARATQSAQLVVVGRPHTFDLPFSLTRPVAMKVLNGAHCPVAIVPSDYAG